MMATGIALMRHPLTQFSFAPLSGHLDMWLLCHEAKSQVHSAATGIPAERVRVYEGYDTNNRVEYDAAHLIETTDCRGIVALSEVDVLRAAQLRTAYGLPGLSYETALLFRDKVLMKHTLGAAGVRVPAFLPVDTGHDLRRAATDFGFPFVVKPRTGGGSVGARVVRDETQLLRMLEAGIGANFYTPAHLEAEEFIAGDIYQVDGLVLDGRITLGTVSWHRSDILDFTTPTSSRMIDQSGEKAVVLREFAATVVRELGLLRPGAHSYFHCEIFDSPQGPVLCEVAARPGGLGIVDQLDAYFGVNTFDLLLTAEFELPTPALPDLRTDGLVGWVAVPRGGDIARLKTVIPQSNWVGERRYGHSAAADRRSSSADFDGAVIVRGATEAELDGLLDEATTRLATVEA
ncbi:ATP-grasp domain-containing protein [Streptomyces sp. ASQP_92]|uniref:ATP-grasp domain-containing protein n=1 Tax=Streptomyces sp. ASQP_92 TaxID=2979116 RepID=UPI0021C0F37F|nr:ATP-grasp domain-containing protein [Streptomyces sp. ASQP_92]MCT9089962.1 ATP-grasp domain-containing protein [Streptomyces sp. ASQP_92]